MKFVGSGLIGVREPAQQIVAQIFNLPGSAKLVASSDGYPKSTERRFVIGILRPAHSKPGGSELLALQTLRAVRLRLCRAACAVTALQTSVVSFS